MKNKTDFDMISITWRCLGTDERGRTFDIPASVPGCLHTDLLRAGMLGDIFYRNQAETAQWVERCHVRYLGSFTLTELPKEKTELVFYGVDTYASIYLNGQFLGETEDMFFSYRYDVGRVLQVGENQIEAVFTPPVEKAANLPPRPGAFTTERLYTRRIQCTYGWDWVQRFVTMGFFKDVKLIFPEKSKLGEGIEGIYVRTVSATPCEARIAVSFDFPGITEEDTLLLEIEDSDGLQAISERVPGTEARTERLLTVKKPRLWWPNGYGEQPLYTLRVKTSRETKELLFGIRQVVISQAEDLPGSTSAETAAKIKQFEHLRIWDRNTVGAEFTVTVNGRRIFCRGADVVPSEPFPSAETEEKIKHLIRLAEDAGVNMLRVWGGGVFGSEAFYDACDRAGIMVTQDFLMACGNYPEENGHFLSLLQREAKEAALHLRNHTSLIWWTADNENAVLGEEGRSDYTGYRAAFFGIAPILRRLDPDRAFLPSSPYGGVPFASAIRGTTHNTQFLGELFSWVRGSDFSDYRCYLEQYLCRFTPEQPAFGMPYLSTLRRFLTDDDIFGESTEMSEYHTKNNPCLGDITLYGYIDRMAKGIFGAYRDGADRLKKMQMLQVEWIRLSMELFRRNAWFSSGILYWMWNDCWPAANSWSILDYYGAPKPAYYAFARAAKPLIGSVTVQDGRVRVYACFDGIGDGEKIGVAGRLYRYNIVTGAENNITGLLADIGEGSTVLCDLPLPDLSNEELLLCDLKSASGTDRAFSLPPQTRFGDMAWIDSEPILAYREDGIQVTAQETIPVLLCDCPGCFVQGNGCFLRKGETVFLPWHKISVFGMPK